MEPYGEKELIVCYTMLVWRNSIQCKGLSWTMILELLIASDWQYLLVSNNPPSYLKQKSKQEYKLIRLAFPYLILVIYHQTAHKSRTAV